MPHPDALSGPVAPRRREVQVLETHPSRQGGCGHKWECRTNGIFHQILVRHVHLTGWFTKTFKFGSQAHTCSYSVAATTCNILHCRKRRQTKTGEQTDGSDFPFASGRPGQGLPSAISRIRILFHESCAAPGDAPSSHVFHKALDRTLMLLSSALTTWPLSSLLLKLLRTKSGPGGES